MRINADFRQPAVVIPQVDAWVHSPESGVDRLMLDRIGDEIARATSLVRYAPGSSFPRHTHAKGEEFLVLDGVFSDESGDFPAGSYVRNPPGSSHAPYSESGGLIFVKLRQFDDFDRRQFVVRTFDEAVWEPGADTLSLHRFGNEVVSMRRLSAGQGFELNPRSLGTEILVVSGALHDRKRRYTGNSWLRFPPGGTARLEADGPSLCWIKTGHLAGGIGDE